MSLVFSQLLMISQIPCKRASFLRTRPEFSVLFRRRWRSNRSGTCSQERLTQGIVTSTMRRAAHTPGGARCSAGAGCSATEYVIHKLEERLDVRHLNVDTDNCHLNVDRVRKLTRQKRAYGVEVQTPNPKRTFM